MRCIQHCLSVLWYTQFLVLLSFSLSKIQIKGIPGQSSNYFSHFPKLNRNTVSLFNDSYSEKCRKRNQEEEKQEWITLTGADIAERVPSVS